MAIPGLPSLWGDPHTRIPRPEAPGQSPDLAKGTEEAALAQRQPLFTPTAGFNGHFRSREENPAPARRGLSTTPRGLAELRLPECSTTLNSISQRPQQRETGRSCYRVFPYSPTALQQGVLFACVSQLRMESDANLSVCSWQKKDPIEVGCRRRGRAKGRQVRLLGRSAARAPPRPPPGTPGHRAAAPSPSREAPSGARQAQDCAGAGVCAAAAAGGTFFPWPRPRAAGGDGRPAQPADPEGPPALATTFSRSAPQRLHFLGTT
ncbi:uncharacterized protein LOC113928029 [Zalophus californianus]|uniref:Uncharacterized protein LOC113928029 n=1 Tax=Zalophus californianus TaxID=9704 RepID=A0A6P9FDS9_ZALCA|nr:uncharacterized protein LOC113928029 [Zalophus californianus]